MELQAYLKENAEELISCSPFKNWHVVRSVEDDLEEVQVSYIFDDKGLELLCDKDDKIDAIFIYSVDLGGFDDSLVEYSFSSTREQNLAHFGKALNSSEPYTDPFLGKCGAWDRFEIPNGIIHFEYDANNDRVKKITFMREDLVVIGET